MEEVHRDTLRKCWIYLMENLTHRELLDYFLSVDLFTADMCEQVEAEKTTADKNSQLLFILQRRGPSAFRTFLEGLRSTNQTFIADYLVNECRALGGSVQ